MVEIKKYIQIKNKDVRTRIEYVQGTNSIPIILQVVDWEIPGGSEARIYVKKPSGKEVYNSAEVSGNEVTIQPTTQMFAEHGRQLGQVQIANGDDIAATFLLEFEIEKKFVTILFDHHYKFHTLFLDIIQHYPLIFLRIFLKLVHMNIDIF